MGEIKSSWEKNAVEWIKVLDSNSIGSRKFTNASIVSFVSNMKGTRVLDMGCGEGWLTRELSKSGKIVVGLDATEALLINARLKGLESYYHMSYEDVIEGQIIPEAPFDLAVFNFSIYQRDQLHQLFKAVKTNLLADGSIVVQTLHPFFLLQNGYEYKSQFITDSWKGLPGNFTDGHSWYARTLEDWFQIISESGLKLRCFKEVINDNNQPVSIIFQAG
ncbi:class I SAM-dependent methyltransferase [Euzebyella saccharophila]|uniref:Class I SAM-dependent methyltransferase n=1 Tax=Euzebyella saccharophila TaxID=679664 RepID=A0ABV8JU95_9FLAO|nr:class I SAM-dependent methyltransferase [Euzebyella saccharophila]